jgi:hypothetical protein
MIYFLLILALGDGIYIESYTTKAECEIRREQARLEHNIRGACLRMETGNHV